MSILRRKKRRRVKDDDEYNPEGTPSQKRRRFRSRNKTTEKFVRPRIDSEVFEGVNDLVQDWQPGFKGSFSEKLNFLNMRCHGMKKELDDKDETIQELREFHFEQIKSVNEELSKSKDIIQSLKQKKSGLMGKMKELSDENKSLKEQYQLLFASFENGKLIKKEQIAMLELRIQQTREDLMFGNSDHKMKVQELTETGMRLKLEIALLREEVANSRITEKKMKMEIEEKNKKMEKFSKGGLSIEFILKNDVFSKYFTSLSVSNVRKEYDKFFPALRKYLLLNDSFQTETVTKDGKKYKMPRKRTRFPNIVIDKIQVMRYFVLFLVRLRTGWTTTALHLLFGMSKSSISCTFNNIILILHYQVWSSIKFDRDVYLQNQTKKAMKNFGKAYVFLIDTTYLYIQKSRNPDKQRKTYCSYKKKNLMKLLTVNSSTGNIVFSFYVDYGGKSDKQIFEYSGLINQLEKWYLSLPEENKFPIILLSDNGFGKEKLTDLTWGTGENKVPAIQLQTPNKIKDGNLCFMVCSIRITVENYYTHFKNFKVLNDLRNNQLQSVLYMKQLCTCITYFLNNYLSKLRQ